MLTDQQKQCGINRLRNKISPLGERKKTANTENLNNSNLKCLNLALKFFTMTVFNISVNLDIYLLEPTFTNSPIPGHLLLTCHPKLPSGSCHIPGICHVCKSNVTTKSGHFPNSRFK